MWPVGVELTPELRDLLEAQAAASDDFPYDVLQVKRPGLSQVYVRQFVRRREVDRKDVEQQEADGQQGERIDTDRKESLRKDKPSGDGADEAAAEAMPVADALDANEHLLITGEAGAGKSTIGQVFCKSISDYWLRGGGTVRVKI